MATKSVKYPILMYRNPTQARSRERLKEVKGTCQTHIYFLYEDKMKEIYHNNRRECGESTLENISNYLWIPSIITVITMQMLFLLER